MIERFAIAMLIAAGCSSREPASRPPLTNTEAAAMPMTCAQARSAIEARRFVGWTGLPPGCTADELFDLPPDTEFGHRMLGSSKAGQRLLALPGYYRPLCSVRDGVVVLFDGTNPELDRGWPALAADLGEPAAKEDFEHGTLDIPKGEWIYPSRGITIFVRTDATMVVHVAVYTPTTLSDYLSTLRPKLGKKLRPSR